MAGPTAVFLSSSPCGSVIATTPPHKQTQSIANSSSPRLPSPSSLWGAHIPKKAVACTEGALPIASRRGFCRASALLQPIDLANAPQTTEKSVTGSPGFDHKEVEIRAVNDSEAVDLLVETDTAARLKKETADLVKISTEKDSEPGTTKATGTNSKKPRKTQTAKKKEGQTKIKTARISKPGVKKIANTSRKVGVEKERDEDRQMAEAKLGEEKDKRTFNLEDSEALIRRKDWTPVKDSDRQIISGDDSKPATSFGSMLGVFSFQEGESGLVSNIATVQQLPGNATTKRRKIVHAQGVVEEPCVAKSPIKKVPKPKKKPQTITEKATAPFLQAALPIEPVFVPSLQNTDIETASANIDEATSTVMGPPEAKRITKARITNGKPTAKSRKKKEEPKMIVLLSPESARKTAQNQEIMFGTSSQLETEDSPSYLRDLQNAMRISEFMAADPDAVVSKELPFAASGSKSSKSLWTMAAQELDNSFVNISTFDLLRSPANRKEEAVADAILPTEGDPTAPDEPSLVLLDNASDVQHPDAKREEENEVVTQMNIDAQAPPPNQPSVEKPRTKRAKSRKQNLDVMPHYIGFTDAQLSKAVTAYGFKKIKSRDTMISTLEKCWQNQKSLQNKAIMPADCNIQTPKKDDEGLGEDETTDLGQSKSATEENRPQALEGENTVVKDSANPESKPIALPPPKRARGRPKKKSPSQSSAQGVQKALQNPPKFRTIIEEEDISDSDPPKPSPRSRMTPTKAKPLPLSPAGKPLVANARPEAMKYPAMFDHMTRAVRSLPPSEDTTNLNWYEKMLLYDPIVIEDLTIWFNLEGLKSVNEDDEVNVDEVKAWCESQSICCLWRENLRGGARARW